MGLRFRVFWQDRVSNKCLYRAAVDKGIPRYMHAQPVDPASWWDGVTCQHEGVPAGGQTQTMSRKMVADVIEALIGVYVTSAGGERGAIALMTWLGLAGVPPLRLKTDGEELASPSPSPSSFSSSSSSSSSSPSLVRQKSGEVFVSDSNIGGREEGAVGEEEGVEGRMTSWGDVSSSIADDWAPPPQLQGVVASLLSASEATAGGVSQMPPVSQQAVEGVEEAVGYRFRSRWVLERALMHPSCGEGGGVGDGGRWGWGFEVLEFLGDAVLDYLGTRHLVEANPGVGPGGLTDLRQVSKRTRPSRASDVTGGLWGWRCRKFDISGRIGVMYT